MFPIAVIKRRIRKLLVNFKISSRVTLSLKNIFLDVEITSNTKYSSMKLFLIYIFLKIRLKYQVCYTNIDRNLRNEICTVLFFIYVIVYGRIRLSRFPINRRANFTKICPTEFVLTCNFFSVRRANENFYSNKYISRWKILKRMLFLNFKSHTVGDQLRKNLSSRSLF